MVPGNSVIPATAKIIRNSEGKGFQKPKILSESMEQKWNFQRGKMDIYWCNTIFEPIDELTVIEHHSGHIMDAKGHEAFPSACITCLSCYLIDSFSRTCFAFYNISSQFWLLKFTWRVCVGYH